MEISCAFGVFGVVLVNIFGVREIVLVPVRCTCRKRSWGRRFGIRSAYRHVGSKIGAVRFTRALEVRLRIKLVFWGSSFA